MQARQGDLFFSPSAKPDEAKPLGTNVLAHGEVTGHMHKVISPSLDQLDVSVDASGDIFLFSKTEDITITHDEHNQVVLPKGKWYKVTRQREYDQVSEEARIVAD